MTTALLSISSHLINVVSIKAKASTTLLAWMSKLLQKSRTQKWPSTLYLVRDHIDEEMLIHFQDLLKDVTRIATNPWATFEKVNEVLQRTHNLLQLESNHINLPLLAHYSAGLEKLVVLGALPQLKEGSLPHLRHLLAKNSGAGHSIQTIFTLQSPFNQAMPNLETFEVKNMNLAGILSFLAAGHCHDHLLPGRIRQAPARLFFYHTSPEVSLCERGSAGRPGKPSSSLHFDFT